MSLERFSRRMRRRAANLPGEVNRVKRKVALAVDQAVVTGTPVDTGRARSNWLVSLGTAHQGTVLAYSPTKGGGIGETDNANGALSQGRAVISQSRSGQPIYIANNVDYIEELNNGSSAQAPASFVEAAIDAGVQAVKSSRIDTGRVR